MPGRNVRCLLVASTFPPVIGGSSAVYENLARRAHGDIIVLTSYLDHRTGVEHEGWRENDAGANYPIHRIALVRPPLAEAAARLGWKRFRSQFRMATALLSAVTRLLKTHGIQVVCIADDETVGWLVPFVRIVLRRAAIIYCHGDDLVRFQGRTWRRRWFRSAHAVIAASRFAFDRLVRDYGVPPSKIALILNGVDRDHFKVEPPSPSLQARLGTAGRRVILTASRLVARKGIDRTLEALPCVLQRYPELLYLIAGDGEQREELQALSERLGVSHAVRFLGSVPPAEMPAYYALAEFVVLPNRATDGNEDGLPLVFLEANACGKPVIGGRAGGTAEVVRDRVNGVLVDGDDASAIAAAILELLSDPLLYDALKCGAVAAAQAADWQGRTGAFLDLCRRLAAKQALSRPLR
jgi:phosphatidylinositol alpha-1,6-mannosyltransferase